MRITNSMLTQQLMRNLNNNMQEMQEKQEQITSGIKFSNPSDSPYEASRSMAINTKRNILTQSTENANQAKSYVNEVDVCLSSINDSFQSIKELTLQATNATYSQELRESVCAEIKEVKETIISLLNSNNTGKYMFAGYNTTTSPLSEESGAMEYNGVEILNMTEDQYLESIGEKYEFTFGYNNSTEVSFTALDIVGYGENNLFNVIDKLTNTLGDAEFDESIVTSEIENLDNCYDKFLTKMVQNGAVSNRIDMQIENMEQIDLYLEEVQASVQGVELEKTVIEYTEAELAYNATLAMGAKTLLPSLLDYLN